MNLKQIVGLGVLFALLAVLGIPLAFSEQFPSSVTQENFPAKAFGKYSSIGRIKGIIDDRDSMILHGNVHPLALTKYDTGAADPSLPMERLILSLRLTPEKQAALDRLLAEQHDPASANFHRWLTPEEFGERFGPSLEDIDKTTNWLISHGFTIDEVAKSRTWINFTGDVSKTENTFQTKIRKYNVNGKLRYANDRDPAIPRALAGLVSGVVSMHSFPREPMNTGARPVPSGAVQPDGVNPNGTHYLTPADFATIYNVNQLYNEGFDGTGVSIAIVGRAHPSSTNWDTFRRKMGLPDKPPQVIVNGTDPGALGGNEDTEANLDVEWAGAVAKNADIIFVTTKSTWFSDGVDGSAQYIVNHTPLLAPIMSTSFSSCEPSGGNAFYNSLWQQAAAEGITSFVSSGDYGAVCSVVRNDAGTVTGWTTGVNGLASTPYNTAVGGTQFDWGTNTDSYWTTGGSAISYIPEIAWKDGWGASGGGVSAYDKPWWQVSPGVPTGSHRYVPDVSLYSAWNGGDAGYAIYDGGYLEVVGGTSAASPSFAGIMALIVQKNGGSWQGNANTRFYPLANAQYGPGGAAIFHDITSGDNNFLAPGYTCTVGYDPVTGLGSVDAYALANNWTSPVTKSYDLAVYKFYRGNASGSVTPNTGVLTWHGVIGTETYFSGTLVTLTATPDPGSVFMGWSGCDSVSGRQCNVVLNNNNTVFPTFAPVNITPVIDYLLLND